MYGFSGQYGGHKTSMIAFKLHGEIRAPGAAVEEWKRYASFRMFR
jgi:hypothetical protein